MLNWIRDYIFKRPSSSRDRGESPTNPIDSLSIRPSSSSKSEDMHTEETLNALPSEKLMLQIIYEGEVWVVSVACHMPLSDLINMAMGHFLNPKDSINKLTAKYKLILIPQKRVLQPQNTAGEEGLEEGANILLMPSILSGQSNPVKLSLQDIKGPTKEEIMAATTHLKARNSVPVVPSLDCQENFQSEIRKVLFTLVEASARILAQSPDAKIIFDGIAARINAKNKKEIDKNAVKYLKDLGFTETQARYALRLKRNRQIEAMEWLLDNSHRVPEDTDDSASTSSPFPPPSATVHDHDPSDPLHTIERLMQDIREFQRRHFEPSGRALDALTAMGFNTDEAVEALRVTGNNQVSACEWLCGERGAELTTNEDSLDPEGQLYKALIHNPAIQLGLQNPKIMLAFLSILENPTSANLWLNDVDTAPVLGQVFKTYHAEKHIMVVNQQMALVRRPDAEART